MKINLNKTFLELTGQPSPPPNENQSKVIAHCLASSQTGDPVKFWGWAQKLYKGETIEIDDSDYEVLLKFVKETTLLNNSGKAQVIQTLIQCKEDAT